MFGEALRFPLAGDDGVKSILIGGLLGLLGFLIIPIFFVQGYTVRVLRVALEGGEEAPAFDEWGDLLVDGVKLFVVGIVYFLLPTILMFISIFAFVGITSVSTAATGEPSPSALAGAGILGLLLLAVTVVLFFLAAYLLPAAAANFARHDDLGAAFDIRTVVDAAFSADYFVAVVFAILVGLLVGVVSAVLSLIIIGLLLVPFLSFYAQVATYYLFGRGFAKGMNLDDGSGSAPSAYATVE
ncbi:DUF4013 domain-containing protein [Halorarius litoreus]|uniref:DUF4013 domain-containing protein n=1 Tax=Halorarius litoreus TaxID=2962676 RepID=UPI0020CBB262|nr:DUF4013 domain-containing protein [Halorarius litoreus]